jgi:hypothetical protein
MIKRALLLSLLGLAAGQAMACYTVYDAGNRVVYQAQTPPVDMSQSPAAVRDAVRARFAGGHLVFGNETDCPRTQAPVAAFVAPRQPSQSPLLTDKRTAEALNLPHTTIAGGIAVVPARAGAVVPSVTVVPAAVSTPVPPVLAAADPIPTNVLGAGPDTRTMGAGPATNVMGGPSAKRAAPETVITEMRDPPVTIIQRGGTIQTLR